MKRTLRVATIPLLLALLAPGLSPARALDKQDRLQVMAAVVQVSLVKIDGEDVYYLPWGSGTIISADGLILTNCHVADPIRFGLSKDEVPDYDYLGIGLTVKSDRPAQLTYLAEVAQADPDLDVAVLRITHKTDLTPVNAEDLNLPFVELGDSDQLEVGDDLNVFGYPGIGGETVTFTRGVASGFTLEAGIEGRAWIKTDASISGGNSGGTGVDEQGLLVGIPTRAGVGGDTAPVDCRPVKDTNGDGRIDGNDDCVPVGGFINALRPVNLAKTLIEASRLGLPDTGKEQSVPNEVQPSTVGKLSNLLFSTGVNEFDQPTQLVHSLPSGARSLYLFFDYAGMDPALSFEMKVLVDGVEQPDLGLSSVQWRGDAQGTWWIGWDDVDLPDGAYQFALYIEGKEAGRGEIQVGGAPVSEPSLSNLSFSVEATAQGGPAEPAVVFPAGTQAITGFYDYANMSDGTKWSRTWTVDGQTLVQKEETWSEGPSGSSSLTLSNSAGLTSGAYRLTISVAGRLAAQSDFWVIGETGSGASFGDVTFGTGIDGKGKPLGAAASFPSGLEELHAFAPYSGMQDGIDFQVNWYVDDAKVLEDAYEWDGGESGDWHYYIYSDGTLPDGTYKVELQAHGETLQTGQTTLGSGTQPTPTPTGTSDGIQIEGHILDLDTERPISGAMFLVLVPGVTVDSFQWTDGEVLTSDQADRQGFFSLPDLLERGECYSVLIGADGYWTHGEDDVCFAQDDPSSIDVTVHLEKQ